MEGRARTGMSWRTVDKLRIGPNHGVLGTVETWAESFIIWPDCVDEIFDFVDELRTLPVKLTFLAIGRVKWNPKLIPGLVLKMNEIYTKFTRIGLFQYHDEKECAI
jgi:hypothetical protein